MNITLDVHVIFIFEILQIQSANPLLAVQSLELLGERFCLCIVRSLLNASWFREVLIEMQMATALCQYVCRTPQTRPWRPQISKSILSHATKCSSLGTTHSPVPGFTVLPSIFFLCWFTNFTLFFQKEMIGSPGWRRIRSTWAAMSSQAPTQTWHNTPAIDGSSIGQCHVEDIKPSHGTHQSEERRFIHATIYACVTVTTQVCTLRTLRM